MAGRLVWCASPREDSVARLSAAVLKLKFINILRIQTGPEPQVSVVMVLEAA